MTKKILVFLLTSMLMSNQSVFALTYQSYGDPNAGAINIFDNYSFENDSDWIAPENTPLSEEMYKFRLSEEAESNSKPKMHTEGGDLILPIASESPCYEIPIKLEELKSLMKSTKDDPSLMMLRINAWYEPANEATYEADEHYRLFDLKAYGGYVCSSCKAQREDYLIEVYGEERRCPWETFQIPVGEQPLYVTDDNGNESLNCIVKHKTSELIFERVCPVEGCGEKMNLNGAWLRVSLSAEDYEGVEEDDFDENGLLPSDKVGKVHLKYLAIERGISGYTWAEDEGVGQRQVMVHDANVVKNSHGYTFSAKALNMRYDEGKKSIFTEYRGASFHPVMLIAGYKDGNLVDVFIKKPSSWSNTNLLVWGTASQVIYENIYGSGQSIDGFQGVTLSVELGDGDYDEVKGFMWESMESMTPNATASLQLGETE